jgi:hypothetical protein
MTDQHRSDRLDRHARLVHLADRRLAAAQKTAERAAALLQRVVPAQTRTQTEAASDGPARG